MSEPKVWQMDVLLALKEARARLREASEHVNRDHAYVMGVAIGVLYGMRDEVRASLQPDGEP